MKTRERLISLRTQRYITASNVVERGCRVSRYETHLYAFALRVKRQSYLQCQWQRLGSGRFALT